MDKYKDHQSQKTMNIRTEQVLIQPFLLDCLHTSSISFNPALMQQLA